MYQTNRIHKNNMLLAAYIFVSIHFLNVQSQNISFFSHTLTDILDYDDTEIYKIMNYSQLENVKDGFMDQTFLNSYYKGNDAIKVHVRRNTIGIPINKENKYFEVLRTNRNEVLINGSLHYYDILSDISYNTKLWKDQYYKLDGTRCDSKWNDKVDLTVPNEKIKHGEFRCYLASAYKYYDQNFLQNKYYNYYGNESIFKLQWTPDHDRTCLMITYIHRNDSKINVNMTIENANNTLITSIDLQKGDTFQTLKINNIKLMKDHTYKISLNTTMSYNYYKNAFNYRRYNYISDDWFELLRIADCSNHEYTTFGRSRTLNTSNSCLNGGFTHPLNSMCICPPGFIGEFCETGCGPNIYGDECNELCSLHSDKLCRGMFMCTSYGCICPAGLTGAWCNKDCSPGKYGNDCKQNCSSNCLDNECDQYTGICTRGCSPGFVLPLCQEKYAYLINPPRLIASNYDTLEIRLDLRSTNIKGGYKNTKLMYYQLLYRPLNAHNFTNSEIKLIIDNDEEPNEILSDLESDTTYMIGVLVITDDGNVNNQDIVFGEYRTSCIQPQITDYNVKLKSGMKSVNITWNNIILKQFECNIIQWDLILTYIEPKFFDFKEIISTSETNHIFDNLNPGYQYKLTLTPKTVKGSLQSSPPYLLTLLITEKEITIKDIVTTVANEKIKVTWKYKNTGFYDALDNEPVTSIIRYKVSRIFSCSLNETQNDWTSILLFNQTNFEISDLVLNAQYTIEIIISDKDKNNTYYKKTVYTLTPPSTPKIEPVLDSEHPVYITNNSVSVQWKVDPEKCSMFNGFFSKYYIELKDKSHSLIHRKETKENYIVFDNLQSQTNYEIKIYIKNNIDYNSEHYLIVNITTKSENLQSVDDLMVYKKSPKNRMVGLRWSYIESANLDGFLFSFDEYDFKKTKNESVIPLKKCTAWPDYYCHTFYHLSPNNYKFKIKPKSVDYPEGGKVSSISFNTIDGLPDSPNNLKYNEIGNTTIGLQWDIPWIFNGELKKFIINAEEVSSIDIDTCCNSFASKDIEIVEELPAYNYTLTDLKPGSTYSIGVLAVSKSQWYSSPARISVTTLLEL